jgi:putative DNA primase/helicase
LSDEDALAAIVAAAKVPGYAFTGRKYSVGGIKKRIADARKKTAGNVVRVFKTTDLGNGERFAYRHGDRLRFNTSSGRWLTWTGARWATDETQEVDRAAKDTVRSIYQEAATIDDKAIRAAVAAWAVKSEKLQHVKAMLDRAKSERPIPAQGKDLDADPMLFNCINGTVDLRTGNLREHDPRDLLTQLSPVTYDPAAKSPLWSAFLNRIFENDADMIGFIQRLVGYCLTGRIDDQVFPVAYGEGANGKSVLFDVLAYILAGYGGQAPESLITASSNDSHPTDIAGCMGKRLMIATETEDGRKLRVGLVKKMTGDGELTARFMRRDFFTFPRTHKTLLVTNHRPVVRETKNAIWRRLLLIPFGVTIPKGEQDPQLIDKLKEQADGILAWAVEGCLAWQRGGLQPPDSVRAATNEYRKEQNPVAEFADDCLIINGDEHNFTTRSAIRDRYASWAKRTGERDRLQNQTLYDALRDHPKVSEGWGEDPFTRKRTRGFRGVSLLPILDGGGQYAG